MCDFGGIRIQEQELGDVAPAQSCRQCRQNLWLRVKTSELHHAEEIPPAVDVSVLSSQPSSEALDDVPIVGGAFTANLL